MLSVHAFIAITNSKLYGRTNNGLYKLLNHHFTTEYSNVTKLPHVETLSREEIEDNSSKVVKKKSLLLKRDFFIKI